MRKARWIGFGALLCVGLATAVVAQDMGAEGRKESTKGAVLKNRAPVSREVLKVQFPRPQEVKLANGLTVMLLEDHRLPTVLFQFQFPHGSLNDPGASPGLASMTADLLKEGTGALNSLQIAQQLDRMGAGFEASAGFGTDVTNVSMSGLSEHTDAMVALLADLVLHPTFPQEELDKYRERELASLAQLRAQPGYLADERLLGALYPGHPMSVIAPTEEALKHIAREQLVEFHDRYYVPNGALLAVTGDFDGKAVIAKLEQAMGGWKPATPPATAQPDIKEALKTRILLVNRPGSVQTNLKMGNIGISRTDPDHIAVSVMNQILGAQSSSRLFMILREEKGFTYGAYSNFRLEPFRGPWTAYAEVRTDVTESALAEFIKQLTRIRTEKVTAEELENAKRGIDARFALSLERPEVLTAKAIELKRFGLPADYWDRYPEMVQQVTLEDVQRVAQKYLDPTKMQIVAVGDADKIRSSLKKFGEVIEYNTEGREVRQP